ncbi:MAG: Salicylate 5-hydroxylase, small oxygenase component [Pseudomonadota bacterium]
MLITPAQLTVENGICGQNFSRKSVSTNFSLARITSGVSETLFHDPYYQRHVVGAPVVRKVEQGRIFSEANYAVFRTKLDKESTVFNVGRYLDIIVQTPEGFKFEERLCIYDSEMIPNSIIYPI